MPNNKKTWVLVTDSSKASIYAMHKAKFLTEPTRDNLEFVADYQHMESRESNQDLVTDKPGTFGSRMYGMSGLDPQTEPKVHEAEVFATQLVRHLELARGEATFKDLIIVAPSAFMGMLNKHMSNELNRLTVQRVEKDYTHCKDAELVQMLHKCF